MSDCKNCAEKHETAVPEAVPYVVYEMEQARAERHSKRWMIAFFVAIAMLFATNIGWLIYESQFETYYYEQDSAAVNNINTGEGSIYNGAETQNQEKADGVK
jgi:hypothetical protein